MYVLGTSLADQRSTFLAKWTLLGFWRILDLLYIFVQEGCGFSFNKYLYHDVSSVPFTIMMHLLQDRNQICGRKQVNFPRFFNGAKHKLHQIHWHGKVQFIIFNWTSRNKQTLVFDKNQYLMDMFGQHLPSLGLSILASHTMQESCYLVTCAEKNS